MKQIKLTKNKFALVDDEDYNYLNQWKWYFCQNGYVARSTWKPRQMIYIHRLLLNCNKTQFVDHIDGNKLNNQKSNLRICTQKENSRNKRKTKPLTSMFKGVSWSKIANKWTARITYNKKIYHLGYFTNETLAAKKYDEKAIELHGKFAKINFKKG